jgi:hypothetical protein
MMDAANFVWVVVTSLFFTSVTCIGVAWAAVYMGRDYSAKLVEGLGNRTSAMGAVMGAVINPDGSETNGQRGYNQHRDYQRAATTTADGR